MVLAREILARLAAHYGRLEPIDESAWAPADRFRLPDGRVVGVIASTTSPFCSTCDRSAPDGRRHVADVPLRHGRHRPARAASGGRHPLTRLAARIEQAWRARADRGAELRAAERERGIYIPASTLKGDPHLEMHTRGG